jgi:valienol-1-phosphate guanylyltransferase
VKKLLGVLLAGGKGQRLKQLTRDLPKPLVPYAAQCRMIDFSLQNCVDSGVAEVLLLSKHMEILIHQYLLREWTDKIGIHFGPYQALHQGSPEDVYREVIKPDELGTADALLNGREYICRDSYEDVLILH